MSSYSVTMCTFQQNKKDQEKKASDEEVENIIEEYCCHDIRIIIRDINTKIGQEMEYMQPYGNIASTESNNNGTQLIHLVVSGWWQQSQTLWSQKKKYIGTTDGNTTNQTDHILIGTQYSNDVLVVKLPKGARGRCLSLYGEGKNERKNHQHKKRTREK